MLIELQHQLGRIEAKVRHVRTPEGAEKYGLPIGSPIVARAKTLVAKRVSGKPIERSITLQDRRKATPKTASIYDKNGLQWLEPSDSQARQGVAAVAFREGGGRVTVWHDDAYRIPGTPRKPDSKFNVTVADRDFNTLGRENGFSSIDAAKKAGIAMHLDLRERAPKRVQREHENFFDNWEGVYGYDWTWGTEDEKLLADADSEDKAVSKRARRILAFEESEAIGITVSGTEKTEIDVAAHEHINALARSYESMYPGFMNYNPNFFIDPSGRKTVNGFNRPVTVVFPMWDSVTESKIVPRSDQFGVQRDWDITEIGLGPHAFGEGFDEKSVEYNTKAATATKWQAINATEIADATGMEVWQVGMLRTLNHELGHTVARIGLGDLKSQQTNTQGYEREFMAGLHNILDYYGALTFPYRGDDPDPSDEALARHMRVNTSQHTTGPSGLKKDVIKAHISEYAASSIHELCAESWASYMMDEKPSQMSVEIAQQMEFYLYKFMASEFPEEEKYRGVQ